MTEKQLQFYCTYCMQKIHIFYSFSFFNSHIFLLSFSLFSFSFFVLLSHSVNLFFTIVHHKTFHLHLKQVSKCRLPPLLGQMKYSNLQPNASLRLSDNERFLCKIHKSSKQCLQDFNQKVGQHLRVTSDEVKMGSRFCI